MYIIYVTARLFKLVKANIFGQQSHLKKILEEQTKGNYLRTASILTRKVFTKVYKIENSLTLLKF